MLVEKVSLADARAFSPFFLDYIQQKASLKPYYNRFPTIDNLSQQLAEKQKTFPDGSRKILVDTLTAQYEGFKVSEAVDSNIRLLADGNTFTVTTGHQLNIFTGPLYFIFKIVTVVNACRRLKAQYPAYNFVPVYWMASEDHDYDEIKYFKLYGQKYVWNTEQSGAVGRFSTAGLDKLALEAPGDNKIFHEAYLKRKTLAAAARHYVNTLFATDGLVVVDADDRRLKSLFKDAIRNDVMHQVNKPLVDRTTQELEQLGYKTQIHCRDINFFYLDEGIRARLEKAGNRFVVVDTDLSFSQAEIEAMIENEPEKFSPNVILRPLYEETILPNIAYVGGPAEVIYWLQLKDVFRNANVPFPALMPRNFGMIVSAEVRRKLEKTGLKIQDLFNDKNTLFNEWTRAHSTNDLSVTYEQQVITGLFDALRQRAGGIDPSLEAFVSASSKRTLTHVEKIAHKMLRAEKRRESDKLRQLDAVKDALFPGGGLQERSDNFLNFFHRDPQFVAELEKYFDPFDFQFYVLSYTS